MKTFFYYCYYKIAKAYKNTIDERDYCMSGSMIMFLTLGFLFLSLLAIIFFLTKNKINAYNFGAIMAVFLIISLFFINKKKYEELEEHYKNEKYSKLKGWLVFLYIIGSFVLYFVSINIFDV